MESIKKHWKDILIVLFALMFMSKCTQSCNRAGAYDELKEQTDSTIVVKDSIIKSLNDSCTALNTTIKVYEEKVSGLSQSLSIQDEAAKRISEAKKNISVSVRNK